MVSNFIFLFSIWAISFDLCLKWPKDRREKYNKVYWRRKAVVTNRRVLHVQHAEIDTPKYQKAKKNSARSGGVYKM